MELYFYLYGEVLDVMGFHVGGSTSVDMVDVPMFVHKHVKALIANNPNK